MERLYEVVREICYELGLDPMDYHGGIFKSWHGVYLLRIAPDRARRFSSYVLNLETLLPTEKSPRKKKLSDSLIGKIKQIDLSKFD